LYQTALIYAEQYFASLVRNESTEVENQLTLRIQFSRDVTLCLWVIGPRCFDAMQVFSFSMVKMSLRLEDFDT